MANSDLLSQWRPSLVGAAIMMLVAAAAMAPTVTAASPTGDQIDAAIKVRSAFGFDTDRSYVSAMLQAGADATSQRHGFPVTQEEAADLDARSAFASRLDVKTLPHVRTMTGYAGEWLDQENGGQLVVAFTKVTDAAQTSVRSRMPKKSRGVRFEEVEYSAAELESALERSEQFLPSVSMGFTPEAVAIQYRHNRIVVKVRPGQLAVARDAKEQLQSDLGVKVGFEAARKISDLTCGGRDNCYNPFRLGIRIRWPNATGGRICGMGFHVKHPANPSANNNHTFLTAGHCVYTDSDGNPDYKGPWYHKQFGQIGSRTSTRYDSTNKRDLALVKINAWSANRTTRIYGDPAGDNTLFTDWGIPIENEELCTSLANTGDYQPDDRLWCGTADVTSQWWISTTHNPALKVWGAALDFSGCSIFSSGPNGCPPWGGDSGSPVFRMNGSQRNPIGIVNAGNRDTPNQKEDHALYFAKLKWAFETGWPNLEVYR